MTAAELACFRTLLEGREPSQPRPDLGLFTRMRARLTIVESDRPPVETARSGANAAPRPAPVPHDPRTGAGHEAIAGSSTVRTLKAVRSGAGVHASRSDIGGDARRRVLKRLEAVLSAERAGLDARIVSAAPAG